MEVEKKKFEFEKRDNDIIYSRAIKAGKRIYYLDVKKSRNDDLYLAITESKKKVMGQNDDVQVTYEKHKIFLYKEDFEKFVEELQDVIGFITKEQGKATPRSEYVPSYKENQEPDVEAMETTKNEKDGNGMDTETKRSFFDKFKF